MQFFGAVMDTTTHRDRDFVEYAAQARKVEFLASDSENRFIRDALNRIAENYRVLAADAARRGMAGH